MRVRAFLRAGRSAAFACLLAAAVSAGACAQEFDTTSRAREPLSLGDDLFATLCDRVAATVDPYDLEGRKSRGVCHPDAEGNYGDTYGDGDMPPKLAVMVRHRAKMIEAFNALFPDKDSLQGDLKDLLAALVPLYDDDTMPESTRTLAAIFEAIAFDQEKPAPDESPADATVRKAKLKRAQEVRAALARLGGRKGYRPIATAIGVARPMLAYDKMAEVTDTTIRLLGPDGAAKPEMRKLLEVAQLELANTKPGPARAPLSGYTDVFSKASNARPKLTSEILRNLLVDVPNDAYAAGGAPVPYLLRDARGFAAFAMAPSGAADKDGDGLPDVNDHGAFIDGSGKVLELPTPFPFVTIDGLGGKGERDAQGRALVSGAPLYKYGDAARTMLHSVLRDTKVLANPSNGALLDLAHGAVRQFGARVDATASYDDPDGSTKSINVSFKKFDANTSPITDLVYALGRFLALPKLPDYLELQRRLIRDYPTQTARLVGAALKIREIANKPEYKDIDLDDKSPLWDEMIAIVGEMAAEPEVMRDVLDSFTDPRVLLLPNGMARFAQFKDGLDYNPSADSCWPMGSAPDDECPQINDPWWNVSTSPPGSKKEPAAKVDWSKPDSEDNRSLFQRFLSLINDTTGVRACNKQGAIITTKLGFISVKLPLFGSYDECESLNIPDLANFYLGCIAGGNIEGTSTPRCKLPITDGMVSAMNSIIGSTNVDKLVEGSSGILGLKQAPTVEALNRLVMWRNPNKFINDLTAPMPTNVCPVKSGALGTRECTNQKDLLRNRHRATIFMGEAYDAVKGLAPTVLPFVKKRADGKGREHYFTRLVSTLHRHWSPGGNEERCKSGASPNDPRFCNKSNARAYEPILAEAFATDIVPALHEISKAVKTMPPINGKSGTEVLASLVRDLLDPKVAAAMKLTDRNGSASTKQNDGKPVAQLTYFHLFADAINKFDTMWGADGAADHELWRAARSKLVDQFLGVEGEGATAKFKNPAITAAGPVLIDLLQDRIAEHKAKGDFEAWSEKELVKSFSESIESPIFAAAMDLQEKIYADKAARDQLGSLLEYMAGEASGNDALASVMTAAQDMMQLMTDDANMVPLYHAMSLAAAPDGALSRGLDLIDRVGKVETGEPYASTHGNRRVIAKVLANAVTPIGSSQITPIEVLIDVVSDLHRAEPTQQGPFEAIDYGTVSKNVQEFLVDPTRGLEQFYAIVKNRNAP